jgi:hypothetical protein
LILSYPAVPSFVKMAATPPEDQARLLEDALVAVRQQTAMMRKCLDTPGKLMDALKCWYVIAGWVPSWPTAPAAFH